MMDIKQLDVTVGEVVEGYYNDDEEGVVGYNGRLDIRPKYQREFVYNIKQQRDVINSVMHDLPLNVIYWCRIGDDRYEVLDGQQRILSLCEYIDGNFSIDERYFDNLPADIREHLLNYKLLVYVCDGTDSDRLEWFNIINIPGEKLTDQELRNAVYAGTWVSDAKRYFSKTGGGADKLAEDYLSGIAIRQDILEAAIKWAADKDNKIGRAHV